MKIDIETKFGSEFQRTHHLKALMLMIMAWESHLESSHKKNKVKTTIDGNTIDYELLKIEATEF